MTFKEHLRNNIAIMAIGQLMKSVKKGTVSINQSNQKHRRAVENKLDT